MKKTVLILGALIFLTGCSKTVYVPPADASMPRSQMLHIRNSNGPGLIKSIGGIKTFSFWTEEIENIYLVEGLYPITVWTVERHTRNVYRHLGERFAGKVVIQGGWDEVSREVRFNKPGYINVSSSDIGRSIEKNDAESMIVGCTPLNSDNLQNTDADVNKIKDQERLANIALGVEKSRYRETQRAAAIRLTDQDLILKVLKEADTDFVRSGAINNLKDQGLLISLVLKSKSVDIRVSAIETLSNQSEDKGYSTLLVYFGQKEADRLDTVEHLRNQGLLRRIAIEYRHKYYGDMVREFVIKRLCEISSQENQAIICKIALEDDSASVRKYAVGKIHQNDDIQYKIASEDNSASVRKKALSKIHLRDEEDQAALEKIYFAETIGDVRASIAKIVGFDFSFNQSGRRKKKLSSLERRQLDFLKKIATEDEDFEVRRIAGKALPDAVASPVSD
ncbi:MAG: membrane lipoprotein lipid attachment site-containing protein [Phycisphaerae bacterium]|nr:membrane lipoprotein lipid attachment site-containing protein [Phycisphaerae bacterium]